MKKQILTLTLAVSIFSGTNAVEASHYSYVDDWYKGTLTTEEVSKVEEYMNSFEEHTAFEVVNFTCENEKEYIFKSVRKPWVKFKISKDDLIWDNLNSNSKYTMIFTDFSKEVLLTMKEIN